MNANANPICLALAAVGLLMSGSGCALPAIEGVFDGRDFAVFDNTPEARGEVNDEILLVFLDLDEPAAQMRTVSVDLKEVSTLETGVDIDIGTDAWDDLRPSVEVVEGTLVIQEIEGNGRLLTVGDDAKRAHSVDGSINLTHNDGTVAGTFRVDLSDGGFLAGSFTSAE